MRPTLNVLSEELIVRILDEAKRIMAEKGMEIRGAKMRQRLLDHGLKADASGERIFFRTMWWSGLSKPRRNRSLCSTVTGSPTRSWAATTSISCPAPAD